MPKLLIFVAILFIFMGCKQTREIKEQGENKKNNPILFYSETVKDTFSIFVNLPVGYNPQQHKKYPVVYLLDANLYFDIMAVVIDKYSEVDLLSPVILVGIGYRDFNTMDSLRNRDYTYPVAPAADSFPISGGAGKFYAFIKNDLIPAIDNKYSTDTNNRILMGHSLGGYFTLCALLQSLSAPENNFSCFIAASPSLNYGNYYLMHQFSEMPPAANRGSKVKAYITYGGLEDTEDAEDTGMIKNEEMMASLSKLLSEKQSGGIIYKSDMYSNLGHMDAQIPTFIKGLHWALNDDK